MGTSTSWFALQGATVEQVAARLTLERAGTEETEGPCFEVGQLTNGWVLVMHRFEENGLVAAPKLLEELSREWRTVACDEESHVGLSASGEWQDGARVWTLVHDNEAGDRPLMQEGEAPAEVRALLSAAATRGDDDGDTYELPLEAARSIVGYGLEHPDSRDVELALYVGPRRVPAAARGAAPKPWWRFW